MNSRSIEWMIRYLYVVHCHFEWTSIHVTVLYGLVHFVKRLILVRTFEICIVRCQWILNVLLCQVETSQQILLWTCLFLYLYVVAHHNAPLDLACTAVTLIIPIFLLLLEPINFPEHVVSILIPSHYFARTLRPLPLVLARRLIPEWPFVLNRRLPLPPLFSQIVPLVLSLLRPNAFPELMHLQFGIPVRVYSP